MHNRPIELLAPAGSVEALRAACIAGADAVYIGGNRFGARAYADNPDNDSLLAAIDLVHRLGKRLHLTVNTLLKDREAEEICDWFRPFYREGVDAVIVQDLGVVRLFRNEFPDVPIHGSTQMAVTGPEGARLLQEMGVSRVIPARELSLEELKRIRSETGMEVETFIHGALCYSYSGKCLMSSMIGGRSGNRGRCAGICRLPFRLSSEEGHNRNRDERFPLNMKDLCALDLLPELISAGICSLKIEGRMKKPEYTAGVVEVYRRALDALYSGKTDSYTDQRDRDQLMALYNRDGFTEGYFGAHNGADMIALENEKQKGERRFTAQPATEKIRRLLAEKEANGALQIPAEGSVTLRFGLPSRCRIRAEIRRPGDETAESVSVVCEGDLPQKAATSPVTEEKIREQFLKTGGSPFFFRDLEVCMDPELFMPVQSIKDLRRRALRKLEEQIRIRFMRESVSGKSPSSDPAAGKNRQDSHAADIGTDLPKLFAGVSDRRQLSVLLSAEGIDAVCLPPELSSEADAVRKAGKQVFLSLPYVLREDCPGRTARLEKLLTSTAWDGVIVRDLEEAGLIRRLRLSGKTVPETCIADAVLYAMNQTAADVLENWGLPIRTLSYELNEQELRVQDTAGSQIVVYGRVPMMISAQCVRKTAGQCCGTPGWESVTDRTNRRFPVWCECDSCTNIIYNSVPTDLIADAERIGRLKCGSVRIDFTDESPEEVRNLADAAIRAFSGRGPETFCYGRNERTRGHFRRGVE